MHKTFKTIGLIITGIATVIISCTDSTIKTESNTKVLDSSQLIKRGEYLITIGGCDDCHSPKKMGANGPEIDMDRRLSGFPSSRPMPAFDSNLVKKGIAQFNEDLTAAAGPWGISFASNLTSDSTGAGSWPLQNFKYALRYGKWKGLEGSRGLLPPMPWFNFAKMSDEDLEAMYAFLKTTKSVENVVPAPKQFANLK
jgi:mono/diheme cytochrome c family protein